MGDMQILGSKEALLQSLKRWLGDVLDELDCREHSNSWIEWYRSKDSTDITDLVATMQRHVVHHKSFQLTRPMTDKEAA
jgi:hypothetical protein